MQPTDPFRQARLQMRTQVPVDKPLAQQGTVLRDKKSVKYHHSCQPVGSHYRTG